MSIDFFTRLPLHGETQFLPGDPRNRGDWQAPENNSGAVSDFAVGDPFTYIDYLGQIARAAEINRFSGVLMVNAPSGEEPWTVCSLLARETRTLKFVSAFQPFHFSPFVAAQMAATYQRASGNRLVWNIINGGSEVMQRQVGDVTGHDERYARASEFMDVVKGYWNNEQFHYAGRYYSAEAGGCVFGHCVQGCSVCGDGAFVPDLGLLLFGQGTGVQAHRPLGGRLGNAVLLRTLAIHV